MDGPFCTCQWQKQCHQMQYLKKTATTCTWNIVCEQAHVFRPRMWVRKPVSQSSYVVHFPIPLTHIICQMATLKCKNHTPEYACRLLEIQKKQFSDQKSSERRTAVNNAWWTNSKFFHWYFIIISSSDTKVSIPVSPYKLVAYSQLENKALCSACTVLLLFHF